MRAPSCWPSSASGAGAWTTWLTGGVGRTSLYRKFAGRDELVYAVLGRELQAVVAAVTEAAGGFERLEDKVVEGALVALGAVEGSLVERLIASDPTTFLPFFTTEAGPLLARPASCWWPRPWPWGP